MNFTALKTITIPSTITRIGAFAFENCNSLENVYYEGTYSQWLNITLTSNPLDYAKNFYFKNSENEYVKYEKTFVTLDYEGTGRYVENADEVKEMFITDFYNWCIKQGAFTANEVSYELFRGENFNGTWFNYTGTPGNPSNLYTYYDSLQLVHLYILHTYRRNIRWPIIRTNPAVPSANTC